MGTYLKEFKLSRVAVVIKFVTIGLSVSMAGKRLKDNRIRQNNPSECFTEPSLNHLTDFRGTKEEANLKLLVQNLFISVKWLRLGSDRNKLC